MYVFRDGRRTVTGGCIRSRVEESVARLEQEVDEDHLLAALIAAGELECALADLNSPSQAAATHITDRLAQFLIEGAEGGASLQAELRQIVVPDEVRMSVAEGFAYYALHPYKFKRAVEELPVSGRAKVVGLRSIGTTLSAVVVAALRIRGVEAQRITVRPEGHPYERQLKLRGEEREWLRDAGNETTVIIVDEGPGISGSSFLAVAEAVEASGVSRENIVLIGSREPDVQNLRAPNAADRWPRFKFISADTAPILPEDAKEEIGGGLWRRVMLEDFENQPASWTQLEAAKYLGENRKQFFKFHGYGHYGEAISERAHKLASGGFGPAFAGIVRGFGKYECVPGRVLTPGDRSPATLDRLAEYCAFRKKEFGAEECDGELVEMANWNWECEFGERIIPEISLKVEHPVVVDGRMQPHEWRETVDGRLLKLDGTNHGDDHFFPGPCDISWDLASTIVEWQLDEHQARQFLAKYRELSGDDSWERLPDYLLGYAVFRMAWSKMAAQASAGEFDETLLRRDYERYRSKAIELAERRDGALKQQRSAIAAQ